MEVDDCRRRRSPGVRASASLRKARTAWKASAEVDGLRSHSLPDFDLVTGIGHG